MAITKKQIMETVEKALRADYPGAFITAGSDAVNIAESEISQSMGYSLVIGKTLSLQKALSQKAKKK